MSLLCLELVAKEGSLLPDARVGLLFLACPVAQAFKQSWVSARLQGGERGFLVPEDLGPPLLPQGLPDPSPEASWSLPTCQAGVLARPMSTALQLLWSHPLLLVIQPHSS